MARRIFACLAAAAILGLLFAPALRAQTSSSISLPTIIDTGKTPPDLIVPNLVDGDVLVGSGDFNGDGATDLLFKHSPKCLGCGILSSDRARIVFGGRGSSASAAGSDSAGNELTLNFDGPPFTNVQGTLTVDGLADLTGGPASDLAVVTATWLDEDMVRIYAVYIIFGSQLAQLQRGVINASQLHADVTVLLPNTVAGLKIVGVGDVNGDGARDLVFITNGSAFATEKVNVLFGPFNSGQTIDLRQKDADVVITHQPLPYQTLGPVSLADVNGDGISDILIGRDTYTGDLARATVSSEVDVLLGSTSFGNRPLIDLSLRPADVTIANASYIAAGDVNGDGIDDIMFSTSVPEKAFCVVFGSESIKGRTIDPAKDQPDVTVSGFMTGLAGPGGVLVADLDGDGIKDILIEGVAPPLTGGHKLVHAFFGVLGSKSLMSGTRIDISRFEQDLTIITPDQTFDLGSFDLGFSFSIDFNGDGAADILIGTGFNPLLQVFQNAPTIDIIFGGRIRAPEITSVEFKHRKLTLTGNNFTGAAQIEVNGAVLTSAPVFSLAEGTLTTEGKPSALNLRPGSNQIVVVRKGSRSDTFDFNF